MTYDFFDVRVVRHQRLSASAVRVTFTGPTLAAFVSGGRDQRCKLFFPAPGQAEPIVPRTPDWYPAWRALDSSTRGVMRTYTVAAHRGDEFDIDFALHPGGGPAIRWAGRVSVGDSLLVLGPTVEDNGGVDFRPPPDTEWVLLAGDETALPALEAIKAWVGSSLPVYTWIAADPSRFAAGPSRFAADSSRFAAGPSRFAAGPSRFAADSSRLAADPSRLAVDSSRFAAAPSRCAADERVVHCPAGLLDPVRAAELPAGRPYAFIAGEAGEIRALRRHLVGDRGFDKRRITFTGYWRRGTSEDDLIEESVA